MEENKSIKKSFIVHNDILGVANMLSDEMAGKLFKIILEYANGNEIEITDFTLKIAFEPIKNSMNRGLEKYKKVCERNKNNGAKGGRPKKENPNNPVGLFETQNNPVGFEITQSNPVEPKKADSDSDSDSDSDLIKEEKENFSSASSTSVFLDSCLGNESWLKLVSKENNIQEKKVSIALRDFHKQSALVEEKYKNEKEFKKHFINWLRRMQEKNIKSNNSKIQL